MKRLNNIAGNELSNASGFMCIMHLSVQSPNSKPVTNYLALEHLGDGRHSLRVSSITGGGKGEGRFASSWCLFVCLLGFKGASTARSFCAHLTAS